MPYSCERRLFCPPFPPLPRPPAILFRYLFISNRSCLQVRTRCNNSTYDRSDKNFLQWYSTNEYLSSLFPYPDILAHRILEKASGGKVVTWNQSAISIYETEKINPVRIFSSKSKKSEFQRRIKSLIYFRYDLSPYFRRSL